MDVFYVSESDKLMADGVLPALGRFQPGEIVGTGGDGSGRDVTIITNLAGEPIRFTINESLSTLVSSASLTLLNADVSELGITTSGVYSSGADAEVVAEDEALWDVIYSGASVQPNQLVSVTEIAGAYTSEVVEGITVYSGADVCTTYWRVITFTVYEDEEGVPYCDVQLESIVAIVLDKTVQDVIATLPPRSPIGVAPIATYDSNGNFIGNIEGDPATVTDDYLMLVDEKYWEGVEGSYGHNKDIDGYAYKDEAEAILGENRVLRFINADYWMLLFTTPISDTEVTVGDGSISFSASVTGLEYMPVRKVYQSGLELWKCIEELLAFNRIMVRFKRDLSLVQWSTDDEGFGEEVDIGSYGTGIKGTYTKENVYSDVNVIGIIGKKDDNGIWNPWYTSEHKLSVHFPLADNVLNGQVKQMPDIVIDSDYLLTSDEEIKSWGTKELYKSFMQARGISVESASMPLSIEAGMKITGTSSLFGTVSMSVTTFSRTTDAQQNTISTSITGRASTISGDSWV